VQAGESFVDHIHYRRPETRLLETTTTTIKPKIPRTPRPRVPLVVIEYNKYTNVYSVFDPIRSRHNIRNVKYLIFDNEHSQNLEAFSIRLLAYLSKEDQNLMISPFSIYSLLLAIAEGARGQTFDEFDAEMGMKNTTRSRNFNQYLNKALE